MEKVRWDHRSDFSRADLETIRQSTEAKAHKVWLEIQAHRESLLCGYIAWVGACAPDSPMLTREALRATHGEWLHWVPELRQDPVTKGWAWHY